MNILHTLLGINLPSVTEIKERIQQEEEVPEFIIYITFALTSDGNLKMKTEWLEESERFAEIYAQLLYQINSGAIEEGMINTLIECGNQSIKSQPFIQMIITKFKELQQQYKNLPLIMPSQALQFRMDK